VFQKFSLLGQPALMYAYRLQVNTAFDRSCRSAQTHSPGTAASLSGDIAMCILESGDEGKNRFAGSASSSTSNVISVLSSGHSSSTA